MGSCTDTVTRGSTLVSFMTTKDTTKVKNEDKLSNKKTYSDVVRCHIATYNQEKEKLCNGTRAGALTYAELAEIERLQAISNLRQRMINIAGEVAHQLSFAVRGGVAVQGSSDCT